MFATARHEDPMRRAAPSQRSNTNDVAFPHLPVDEGRTVPTMHHGWSPYNDNGGTTAAIAGKGYVVVAADTRLNGNYNILTRDDSSKIFKITDKTYLASTGMQGDRLQLQQILLHRKKWYKYNAGGRDPKTSAVSQLLSSILYGRRFFPYYSFNIIVGLDDNGDGVCYSYDVVGCTEPLKYGVTGTAASFIEPLLDCVISRGNQSQYDAPKDLTLEEAMETLKNAFTSASERDVFTGDAVKFHIITADGVREETLALRED